MFEEYAQTKVKTATLDGLQRRYSLSPGSGIWILEYGKTFVGLAAVECQPEVKMAYLRHFHVEEAYRNTHIQDDLLRHAIDQAVHREPELDGVEAIGYDNLVAYVEDSLRRVGFQRQNILNVMGIFRWRISTFYLPTAK